VERVVKQCGSHAIAAWIAVLKQRRSGLEAGVDLLTLIETTKFNSGLEVF
jgi:hypothetical protein